MNEKTTTTLEDIQALTRQPWPSDPVEAREVIKSQFHGRPQLLQDNLLIDQEGERVTDVGWFIFYDSAEELLKEHDAFCASLTDLVGAPFDLTPTTAAWRTGGFLVESYAHPATHRDPKSSHQIGIGSRGTW